MKNFKLHMLYSGSRGNSALVRVGDVSILIDAGKTERALCRALCEVGEDIKNIKAIFITHEHVDHISALEMISQKYDIPIYMTERSAQKLAENSPIRKNLCERTLVFCEEIDGVRVRSFATPHDSLACVGYRIEFDDERGTHALGYATDLGTVDNNVWAGFNGCEVIVIEANHDTDMLMTGPYPYYLKHRIQSNDGHLSNEICAKLCGALVKNGTKAIMLAHLSEDNNLHDLAKNAVREAIADESVSVCVARQNETVELVIPQN